MICEALSPPHYETAIAHVAAAAWEVWLDIEAARHAVRYRHPEPGWLLLSSKILRWWSWHNCYPTMKLVTLTRKAEWDMKYWEKEARSGNTSYVIMRSMMRMMRHQNLSTSNGQDNPDSISSFMSIMASYFNPKMSLTSFKALILYIIYLTLFVWCKKVYFQLAIVLREWFCFSPHLKAV